MSSARGTRSGQPSRGRCSRRNGILVVRCRSTAGNHGSSAASSPQTWRSSHSRSPRRAAFSGRARTGSSTRCRLPARGQPGPLGGSEDDAGNGSLHDGMWALPSRIAQRQRSRLAGAVVHEDRLLAVLVLEVAEIVVWLGVVDRGRRAARVGVMVRDAEDRLLSCSHRAWSERRWHVNGPFKACRSTKSRGGGRGNISRLRGFRCHRAAIGRVGSVPTVRRPPSSGADCGGVRVTPGHDRVTSTRMAFAVKSSRVSVARKWACSSARGCSRARLRSPSPDRNGPVRIGARELGIVSRVRARALRGRASPLRGSGAARVFGLWSLCARIHALPLRFVRPRLACGVFLQRKISLPQLLR